VTPDMDDLRGMLAVVAIVAGAVVEGIPLSRDAAIGLQWLTSEMLRAL